MMNSSSGQMHIIPDACTYYHLFKYSITRKVFPKIGSHKNPEALRNIDFIPPPSGPFSRKTDRRAACCEETLNPGSRSPRHEKTQVIRPGFFPCGRWDFVIDACKTATAPHSDIYVDISAIVPLLFQKTTCSHQNFHQGKTSKDDLSDNTCSKQ